VSEISLLSPVKFSNNLTNNRPERREKARSVASGQVDERLALVQARSSLFEVSEVARTRRLVTPRGGEEPFRRGVASPKRGCRGETT